MSERDSEWTRYALVLGEAPRARTAGRPRRVDGAWIPDPLHIDVTRGDGLEVRLSIRLDDGRWTASAVEVVGDTVTAADMRQVARDLDQLVESAVVNWSHTPMRWATGELAEDPQYALPASAEAHRAHHDATGRRQRRRDLTPTLLREVADVYREGGRTPTEAVRQHFVVSRATASRWVRAARDEGIL